MGFNQIVLIEQTVFLYVWTFVVLQLLITRQPTSRTPGNDVISEKGYDIENAVTWIICLFIWFFFFPPFFFLHLIIKYQVCVYVHSNKQIACKWRARTTRRSRVEFAENNTGRRKRINFKDVIYRRKPRKLRRSCYPKDVLYYYIRR